MLKDLRSAVDACALHDVVDPPFDGTFSAWQMGGTGAGTIAPTATAHTMLPTYTLTAAEVGSKYELAAFADYWGAKPYFEKVEMPVITDVSAQQLQFNNGQIAAILHDLPSSAVGQYLNDSKYSHYSLPTMMSNYIYINPRKGMMTDVKNRNAVMQASAQ